MSSQGRVEGGCSPGAGPAGAGDGSAHSCRGCSSGGRLHPVYTPFVMLYSSKAPKHGS